MYCLLYGGSEKLLGKRTEVALAFERFDMILRLSQRASRCVSAVIVLAACCSGPSQTTSLPDQASVEEDEVIAFIEAYDTAWLNKDTLRLKGYLDSNYVYFSSRGAIRDRRYVLELVGHPTYRVEDMSRTEIIPRIHGWLAIVATRWTATPYYQGVRYDDDQRCVLILSKQSGSLQLLSDHCTEIMD